MPSPPKTSAVEILVAARGIVHARGALALSMNEVATAVGIRAPSLYKHYADRAELVGAIRTVAARELSAAIRVPLRSNDPALALRSMARAMRAYARAAPHLYELVMTTGDGHDLSGDENQQMLAPILTQVKALSPRRTGDAARLLTAFVHGFVEMERNGAFRLGGDLDASFEFGLEQIVSSFRSPSPARAGRARGASKRR